MHVMQWAFDCKRKLSCESKQIHAFCFCYGLLVFVFVFVCFSWSKTFESSRFFAQSCSVLWLVGGDSFSFFILFNSKLSRIYLSYFFSSSFQNWSAMSSATKNSVLNFKRFTLRNISFAWCVIFCVFCPNLPKGKLLMYIKKKKSTQSER